MREWFLAKVHDWYILGIGLIIVGGGFIAASWYSPGVGPSNIAPSANGQPGPQATSETTVSRPPNSQPALQATSDATQPAASPSTNSQPAPQTFSAAQPAASPPGTQPATSSSHDHATATRPAAVAQNVGQAPTANAPASPASPGEAEVGRQVYKKCQACHSLEPGKNGVGPSLAGIIGKKAASVDNYNYSPAMKASNLTWDVATLNKYLLDPQKAMPGNKMPFPGLKTETERNALIAYIGGGETPAAPAARPPTVAQTAPPATAQPPSGQTASGQPTASYDPGVRYTLRSGIAEGRMVFIGVGGAIDGQVNPVLSAAEGQVVQITLLNGEGAEHDIVFADQGPTARSSRITGKGASTTLAFPVLKAGDFIYFCSLPGHQLAGMQGQFLVTPRPPPQAVVEADITHRSADVPPPIGKRDPQTVRVDLVTVELEGRLAEGTTFGYWTFNGKVPGPFLRVRVGDTVEVHLKNASESSMIHSVDFHAATGPGGGAASTQANPGEEKTVKFKALVPGLYVYHCATPMVAHHIANGMYGLILVEPEGGLPPVDREFYVMQGEVYTEGPFGQHGSQEFNVEKLLNERPEYFVFNGSVGALSKLHPLEAKVGETVRIFFGVGGPNFTSAFHVIGEIFDKVYNLGGVLGEPLRGIQTVTVPAGGAVITEFKLDVPGSFTLVDHALSRMERGLVGVLHVEGPSNPEIYEGKMEPGSGH
jgi:nitrite reductase (NO-forming)